MRGRRLTTAAVVAVLTLGPGALSPAAGATPSHPPTDPRSSIAPGKGMDAESTDGKGTDGTTGTGGTNPDERTPLTPEQVKKQVAEAQTLQAELKKNDAALAKAAQELAALAATSNAAMSKVGEARAAEDKAAATEKAELAKLKLLTAEVAAAQRDLDRMAYDAYVNGPGLLRQVAAVMDLVSADGQGADAAAQAEFVAKARSADQKHFEQLAAKQRRTAQRAAAARSAREKATASAEKAQKAASAAVADQQKAVLALQKLGEGKKARLGKLGATGGPTGVDLSALAQISTTPLCTEENATYPNGMWPGSALCALRTAPGHMLRPSAARAFDAMSQAYGKANGTNLCITDSYRSYASQVDVRRRKPTLAAVPGTSNHGLGLAVDLCGGVESFGTPQHLWMQQHAPLFGFFHPSWAEPSGSKPEPWHWEFAG